jgi:hypothetical protein
MKVLLISILILFLSPICWSSTSYGEEVEYKGSLSDGAIEFKHSVEGAYPRVVTHVLKSNLGSGFVLTGDIVPNLSLRSTVLLSKFSIIVVTLDKNFWIVYGVKFSNEDEHYVEGSVVDLDILAKEGNLIYQLYLDNEEMYKIINIFN